MDVQQKPAKFDAEQWNGTQFSRDAVIALVEHVNPGTDFEWSVDQDGSLVGTRPYSRPFTVPAGHYMVHGPYWGGDAWETEGGGDRPWEVCTPALYSNKYGPA